MARHLNRRNLMTATLAAGAGTLVAALSSRLTIAVGADALQETIMRQEVTFQSNGLTIVAHLYSPEGDAGQRWPAIVVSHPAGGVKEQTAGLYSRLLAEQGFVTIAFDTAFYGESEGTPRGLEDPAQRVEDIKSAVSFLTQRPEVDPERIGLLGICASGGYIIPATATDLRIKAVAGVSPAEIGRFFRDGYDGKQDPAVFQAMLDNAAKARTAEARGEGPQAFPVFPPDEQSARDMGQYVFEGWEYYCTDRAQHPRSVTRMPWISVDKIGSFDGFRFIDAIAPRPLLLVAGTKADTRWIAEEAFEMAADPKELVWIEGASHVDLYDRLEYVEPAVAHLTKFYRDSLAG